ncbi:MAG: HTH-type transcriptional repressor AseR [bacterium ADurb.Bin157]|jgi:ArsR family transcriptional regulator|nr:MAG: HTH-type transcriptional repressor AseR [bacterium ADurb.Bin157]
MDKTKVLKAIADESRMSILKLLLRHNYCVRALANELELTEATVSQHLKVLREAGLLVGEKRGYFMHYSVEREVLHELAKGIEALAAIEEEVCQPEECDDCLAEEKEECHKKGECSNEVKEFCHGKKNEN